MWHALYLGCVVSVVTACASPCKPQITQARAIRIAKQQLARQDGAKIVSCYGPYTAELLGCEWKVRGATPPGDVGGDIVISVDATTGTAIVRPTLRTDTRKLGELKKEPQ